MTDNSVNKRRAELMNFLDIRIKSSKYWRRVNNSSAIFFMATAVVASVASGIAGVSGLLDSKIVGTIALIPGACALLASSINFDQRTITNRKRQRLFAALSYRLKFELPEPPTLDQLALISREIVKIDEEIDKEYEEKIKLGWTVFQRSRERQ